MDNRTIRSLRVISAIGLPLLAAGGMWRPVLDVYFHGDDFVHLYDAVTLATPRLLSQIWGGHLMTVFNAITLGLFGLFGPDPRAAFGLMYATHLANVLLVYWVVRRLGGDPVLASAGALAWGTCPTLVGALGWYSVYGQVLLTTLVLAVVGDLAGRIAGGRMVSLARAAAWAMALACGGASFGNGMGIAAVFPLVVWLAFPREQRSRGVLVVLLATAGLLVAAYVGARVYWRDGDSLMRLSHRLTWIDAIVGALPRVPGMLAHMLAFAPYALVAGFLAPGVEPPERLEALAVLIASGLLMAGWLTSPPRGRRIHVAVILLLGVTYATIAAGRVAVFEHFSSFGPLSRVALWPRYHYLALGLLTLGLATALAAIQARGPRARAIVRVALGAWIVLRLVLLVLRPTPIDRYPEERAEVTAVLAAIHQAVSAAPEGAVVRIPNKPFGIMPWRIPGWAGLFVIHFSGDVVAGRPVRFTAAQGEWANAQARGGRIASIVERR
jgi:hypothetical protein